LCSLTHFIGLPKQHTLSTSLAGVERICLHLTLVHDRR
jgi:hypothetical protein